MTCKIIEISSLLKFGEDGVDIQDWQFLETLWAEVQAGTLNEYQFMAIVQRAMDRSLSHGMKLGEELAV